MTALTLDLHGRRLEEAIAEVTLYFDRIRRTYASVNAAAAAAPSSSLDVIIITGKGSHSTQGAVLRSGVQKLLIKRGMKFSIEPGKGAFKVDALSGWDLYAAGAATDSKVLLSEQQEFHLMAASKKNARHGASFHQAATGICAPVTRKSSKNHQKDDSSLSSKGSSGPLPKHIILEEDAISIAHKQSISEAQKQKAAENKLKQQHRLDMKKAIEASRAEYSVYSRTKEDEEAELRKALELSSHEVTQENIVSEDENDALKMAIEQSLFDEQERKEQQNKQFEEELNLVLEQSAANSEQENSTSMRNQEGLDLLKILELSLKEKIVDDMSEEDALQRAIQLSQHSSNQEHAGDVVFDEMQHLSIAEQEEEEFEENDLIQKAMEQQHKQIVVTHAAWFYVDPHDNVQGPFEGDMMRAWLAAGYFNGDLRISQCQHGPFYTLSTIFPFYLASAFVPDVD